MNRSNCSIITVGLIALVLSGCAQSVTLVRPQENSAQINPVNFLVNFHPRASRNTFRALLQGQGIQQDLTANFVPIPGQPLTAQATAPAPYLLPGNYTLRTEAEMSPLQNFDSTGRNWDFQVPSRPITFQVVYQVTGLTASSTPPGTPPPTHTTASMIPLDMNKLIVRYSETGRVQLRLNETASRDVSVTLEPSNARIALNGQPPGAPVTITILAGHSLEVVTVQGIQLGDAQITGKARAAGYHDGMIEVTVVT